MADRVVNQGLDDVLANWAGIITDPLDAIAVSNFGTLLAGTTSIAAAGFSQINGLDGNESVTSQVLTIAADFTSAQISGNQITTITAHNDGAGVATGVQLGVDAQDLTFSGVDLTVEMDIGAATA